MTGMTLERLAEIRVRADMPRLGLSLAREMDKDVIAIRELVAEIERLQAGRDIEQRALSNALPLLAERDALAQQIEKVRALHFTVVPADWLGGPTRCGGCGDAYPCRTIRALDA